MHSDEALEPTNHLDVQYLGRAGALFLLAFKTLALTVVTLGIYRFWMKARLRRYYWSATQIGGQPLEYTGTGLEKLLGVFIAVVFLAIYLGILQLFLSFIGLAFLQGNPLATNIAFIAILPLIYFAQYRARRYILSRTRWRGLRFAAEPVARRYMLLAMGHTVLTAVTLGFLYPRQVFKLDQFATNRTWYGDLPLRQEGSWTKLLPAWLAVMASFTLVVVVSGVASFSAVQGDPMSPTAVSSGLVIGLILSFVAFFNFAVVSFRYRASNKVIGKDTRLASRARTLKVTAIYILASLGLSVILLIAGLILFGAIFAVAAMMSAVGDLTLDGSTITDFSENGLNLGLVVMGVAYITLLVVMAAFTEILLQQPLWRHFAETMTIENANELEMARQREGDDAIEAEGFADALDVGAAI